MQYIVFGDVLVSIRAHHDYERSFLAQRRVEF